LDSPIARQDVRLDITDLYVFRGETGTAFVMNVCHSIAGHIPVPGYHPEGKYEFKIDLDCDAVEDITYRFTFEPRDSSGNQRFELRKIAGSQSGSPVDQGRVVLSGRTGETTVGNNVRVWTGRAGDPFWIEPDVLHAVGHAFQDGTAIDLSAWDSSKARNLFAGHTVYSIVLEVADGELPAGSSATRRIGVWSVASLATDAGGWRSINRVGLPMIHPLFTQFNEDLGNRLNAGNPADDMAAYGGTMRSAIARVVAARGTADDAAAYADRVVNRFLPNVLPYDVGSKAAFGFATWNGRSLIDNAPEVMFSIAANTPVSLGIGKESVATKPSDAFPYVPPVPERGANARQPAEAASR
jgi:hypothetical protein